MNCDSSVCTHRRVCCGFCGRRRSSHGRTYRVYFRTAMPALVGALGVFTVVTFSYITDVRPQMVASWDAVKQSYPERNLVEVRAPQSITWRPERSRRPSSSLASTYGLLLV
jgi:hypothetical protein